MDAHTKLAGVLLWLMLIPTPLLVAADAEPFHSLSVESDLVVVGWNPDRVLRARDERRSLRVLDFPLPSGRTVALELEPFSVTTPRTRFVLGRRGAPDRELDFDPQRLAFFRGRVTGQAGSHVFLALSEGIATGSIDLGGGAGRFAVSSRGRDGDPLPDGSFSVFAARGAAGLPPDVPLCGVGDTPGGAAVPVPEGAAEPVPGLQHLQLAVETDYEYFSLFGNADDAAAYLVALYATLSDVYVRDVNTWVELSFVRLWDDPDDLFNVVDPTPLFDFADHWNTYMGGVTRDAAQLVSGRSDYPFGGQAFLSALCSTSGYSVVGYVNGILPDPSHPSPYQYDLFVTAHELGHNAGTGHTQDYGIDTCHTPSGSPQRGTIMSYCSQTWSGGNANSDVYFHAIVQQNIEAHVAASSCIVPDCNRNGIVDGGDILGGAPDVNANLVPDVCEDCNGNGVLDDEDIARATSDDLNANGIPDECEPDCDANGIPDDKQIDDGTSVDAYGNDIPDECETDCDSDGISDYTEIQSDMTLDVDRDAGLDACQDCDTDGTTDHDELAGAHDAWVASGLGGSPIRRFFATTGVKVATSSGGAGSSVSEGQDLIVAPGGRVLVSSGADDRVMEFDLEGSYQGDLVASGSGGLDHPAGLWMTETGTLLVASFLTDEVLAYDGTSGAFLGPFVTAGSGGLAGPFGLTYGPDGDLYVTASTNEILRFDGEDGAFVGTFVSAGSNGTLTEPRGLVFKPDGNLLVTSYGSNEVLEYGAGGEPLGKWALVGTASVLTQVSPWGIRVGPNGNVFVTRTGEDNGSAVVAGHHDDGHDALHLTNAQIYEYDVRTGAFIRAYIGGNDHGLTFATGFDFVPGWETDCNDNLLPDECDVASGASADADASGVPDECETDCNGNGVLDRLDVIPHGTELDCNANLLPDACDLALGTSTDCDGNGTPDECDPDCNGNGTADACDIAAGDVTDCNANGVPDLCDVTFDFETDQGWSPAAPGDTASDGLWTRVNPVGTAVQTEYDHTPGDGRECYVTGQGIVGGLENADDVDGGATTLTSPLLDLSRDPDPEIGYWRWFSNVTGGGSSGDLFRVELSNDDGGAWTSVEILGPGGPGTQGGWEFHMFRVSDFLPPTSAMRLRFIASDTEGDSTVEAALDDVVVVAACCQSAAACEDGLACTVESCNVAAGQCGFDIAPGSCLIQGACWSAGATNPVDDCLVCDPLSPEEWTPAPPVEVEGLGVGTENGTRVTWDGQGAAAVYDVAGGLISDLAGAGTTDAICLADDVATTFWDDPRPDPPAGDGYTYFVRAEKSCGKGTYGTASAGEERLLDVDCP